MKRKQLAALFVCSLIPVTVGNALLAFLPVYAIELGADKTTTGLYLSLSFAALACGTLIGGWLSDRFQKRKLTLILLGIISMPVIFLMGRANSVALLTVFTMLAWLMGGFSSATVNILTGMYAAPRQRGRIFGIIIGTTGALGQVIGGFSSGLIVEHWGYGALFNFCGFIWIIGILAALFLEDRVDVREKAQQIQARAVPFNAALWLLIAASIVAPITSFIVGMTRPLVMDGLGFDPNAISSPITISGLVALPMAYLIGWLSDRVGRRQILIVSYAIASVGALVLVFASDLWQFWLSACMFALAGSVVGVAYAYVTELAPPETQNTALARYSSTNFVAGVIGFGATGVIIQQFGTTTTLLVGAIAPVVGILLVLSIRARVRLAAA